MKRGSTVNVWGKIKNELKKSQFVWDCYDVIYTAYNCVRGWYWQTELKFFGPQKLADAMKDRQHIEGEVHVDLEEPISFFDKMQWLKYYIYNKSSLVASCYNKYTVREYLKQKGCEGCLNQLYGAWDAIDEIPWDELPDEFVMKVANGYSNHVFKRAGEPFDQKKAIKTLRKSSWFTKFAFRINGDMFAYETPQKIICERLLHSADGYKVPDDYKFYCFHGVPRYIEVMWDRYGANKKYNEIFVDIDLNDRHDLEAEASDEPYVWPPCLDEMKDLAAKLSEDFPFVRVDFYVENGHPVFGELTFTPYHAQTEQSMTELGALIDMTIMNEYIDRLVDLE